MFEQDRLWFETALLWGNKKLIPFTRNTWNHSLAFLTHLYFYLALVSWPDRPTECRDKFHKLFLPPELLDVDRISSSLYYSVSLQWSLTCGIDWIQLCRCLLSSYNHCYESSTWGFGGFFSNWCNWWIYQGHQSESLQVLQYKTRILKWRGRKELFDFSFPLCLFTKKKIRGNKYFKNSSHFSASLLLRLRLRRKSKKSFWSSFL